MISIIVVGMILTFSNVSYGQDVDSNQNTKKISRPFQYSGYTFPEYDDYMKRSQYVGMSDGVKLAVDIYIPSKGPEKLKYPVIFQYTPYGRAYVIPNQRWWEKPIVWFATNTMGPVLDRANSKNTVYGSDKEIVNLFLSHGYVYICADMRGTGASYGSKMDFMPKLADDGLELVNWIEKQEWCDGNVGMFGGSYLGYSQLITAEKKPKALKCIFPEVVPLDGYTGEIRPGGIFLWAYSQQDLQGYLEKNYYLPKEGFYPTAPVLDEDGDGDLSDEIPIDKNSNGTFLDDYAYPDDPNDPPKYKDGQKRNHIYYLATYDHKKNVPYSSIGPKAVFIDTEFELIDATNKTMIKATAYDVGPAHYIPSIMESGIPIYNHGGWMDAFARGTTELYSTLKNTNPSKLVIDPGYHLGTSPFWKYCGEDENESLAKYGIELLRYFDRYLKGIKNGIDAEPPIYIYNMNGDGWRFENEWPLSRQVLTEYFLNDKGMLDTIQSADGSDEYVVNFQHDSRWKSNWGDMISRWVMETPADLPIRTDKDKQTLIYTSAPLKTDTEVTGHPIIYLWVSSTAANGDFFVYLEDVDKNGQSILVTEGLLRAGFAKLQDNGAIINRGKEGIKVLPKLPWHGYEKNQYDMQVFANGAKIKLEFDLLPTSWVFRKGHCLRVSIACVDWPTFAILPELSATNDPKNQKNIIPTITIYRDAEHPSNIVLPIIPR